MNTNVYSIYQEQSAAVDRRRFGLDLPQWQISLDNDITTTFLASAHTNNPIYVLIAATHPVNKLLCLLQNSKGSRVRFASVWIASPWPLSSPHRNTQKYTSGVGDRTWHPSYVSLKFNKDNSPTQQAFAGRVSGKGAWQDCELTLWGQDNIVFCWPITSASFSQCDHTEKKLKNI